MGTIYVNRSGARKTVYTSTAGNVVQGYIDPNNIYAWLESFAGGEAVGYYIQRVRYRDAQSNTTKEGWLPAKWGDSHFVELSKCSLYNVDINGDGNIYHVFKVRRRSMLMDRNGTILNKTAEANSYIATSGSTSGYNNPEWLKIEYYGPYEPEPLDAFISLSFSNGTNLSSNAAIIGNI